MKRSLLGGLCLSAALLSFSPAHAQVYVYPQQGQSPEQQSADQRDCQNSASAQTGYVPGQQGQVGRNTLRGGARGAAAGAIIGGVSGGSAGKGAGAGALLGGVTSGVRTASRENQAQSNWTRAFSACMQARGYSVG